MSLSDLLVPRILTEIYGPSGMRRRKLRIDGNQVIVKRAAKGRGSPDYRATFDESSIVLFRKGYWPFRFLRQKLMLIDGADHCIRFSYAVDRGTVVMPVYDRAAMERMAEATVVKNAGNVSAKMQVPGSLFMVSMLGLVLNVLTLLVVSGRLKV